MKNTLFIVGVILFTLFSCKTDCVSLAQSYRETGCNIIVKNLPNSTSGYNFKINGKSLKTGNDTIYDEENRWFCSFYKFIESGDTILKSNKELVFNIHKKDTILRFQWDCDGKIYK